MIKSIRTAISLALIGVMTQLASPVPQTPARGMVVASGGITAPTDIANCAEWLDGADISQLFQDSGFTTPVAANSDPVGGWKDKSGNANHITQSTAGLRGLYKTGVLNGKSGILFDGVGSQYTTILGSLGAHSIYVVAQNKSTTSSSYHALAVDAGGTVGLWFHCVSGSSGDFKPNLYSSGDHESTSIPVNTFVLFSAIVTGTGSANISTNGVSFYNSTGIYSTVTYARVGGHGSEWQNGHICELVIFSRALTGTEDAKMITFEKNKWGL